ncbi:hypothetical protein [Bacillus vallismortis]|nr:hypothetical protein [Bacillus vallismortis]
MNSGQNKKLQNNLKKVVDEMEAKCYISKAASLRGNEMIFEN